MTDDLLRDLAKDLPVERPTAARRDAIRSSLLVEAAESTVSRPVTARRWPMIAAFTAGALAAAAIAVIIVRRPVPPAERANLAQVTATTPEVRIEHHIVATEHGTDEIVRIREGVIALAIPAQRQGDRMIVKTTTADVEGDAGELEVTVVNEQLQAVRVKTGTAKVVVIGQAPVILSAGQTWRASVITADLSPTQSPSTIAAAKSGSTNTATPADATNSAPTGSTNPAATFDATNKAPVDSTDAAAKSGSANATSKFDATTSEPTKSRSTKTSVVARGDAKLNEPGPGATRVEGESKTNDSTTSVVARVDSKQDSKLSVESKPGDSKPGDSKSSTVARVETKPGDPKTGTSKSSIETIPPVEPTPSITKPPVAVVKPLSIEQRFKRGWDLLRAGKAQQAADELGAAADASPEAPLAADARYFQAVALVRANDPRAAERVLVQFLDSSPTSLRRGRAAVLLGRLLAERGDPASARRWLESAATDPDPAIAAAAKAGLQNLK